MNFINVLIIIRADCYGMKHVFVAFLVVMTIARTKVKCHIVPYLCVSQRVTSKMTNIFCSCLMGKKLSWSFYSKIVDLGG